MFTFLVLSFYIFYLTSDTKLSMSDFLWNLLWSEPEEPTHGYDILEIVLRPFKRLVTAKRNAYDTVPAAEYKITNGVLDVSNLFDYIEYVARAIMPSFSGITFSDVLTIFFFIFGTHVALKLFRKDTMVKKSGCSLKPIPSENLEQHIQNVSTLIDKMHESHSQITQRMWELQVPLTMVKYKSKMMDEEYPDTEAPNYPKLMEANTININVPK